ncbi:Virulence activator alpha C-term [Anaerovirgula multivorans]|uniref:Virulence activator alpha C-term n=1 Tax=Anaerovirgula multivorans TaxID=312168 RepID=A0A239LDV1_9FIRM|nr:PadR family transcriptional regulator [Anaerovirgula multivorans]SNT28495.1 Virulence activator alpha C-term [Anaerovirgula multivorans]
MSLKHGLLGLLNYGSMTGYELDKAFKASLSFFWQAKTSQVYRELDAMERIGWLISERIMQTEKPNKRVYTITDRGKEEFLNWMSFPELDIADAMRVKSAFLMRIFFAGETSIEQSLEMLRAYRAKCLESKEALKIACAASSEYGVIVDDDEKSKFWDISILYGEAFYDASFHWADKAIAILEGRNL